jgi:hypothetical protein
MAVINRHRSECACVSGAMMHDSRRHIDELLDLEVSMLPFAEALHIARLTCDSNANIALVQLLVQLRETHQNPSFPSLVAHCLIQHRIELSELEAHHTWTEGK